MKAAPEQVERQLLAAEDAAISLAMIKGCLTVASAYADNHSLPELGWLLTAIESHARNAEKALSDAIGM